MRCPFQVNQTPTPVCKREVYAINGQELCDARSDAVSEWRMGFEVSVVDDLFLVQENACFWRVLIFEPAKGIFHFEAMSHVDNGSHVRGLLMRMLIHASFSAACSS